MNSKRKLILYSLLGAMVLLQAGDWLIAQVLLSKLDERQETAEDLQEQIGMRQKELADFRELVDEMVVWESQSLPTDLEVARTEYRAWLFDLVSRTGISNPNVDSGVPSRRHGLFDQLPFSVKGRTNLEQLTRFLFDFYRAGHLHRIQSLSITPLPNRGELEVTLSIEALAMSSADRQHELSTETSGRLASVDWKAYRGIVHRNLFGLGGAFDPISQTYLSAVISSDGTEEAWFDIRTDSKVEKLRKGDALRVGTFDGRVVDIDRTDVVLESEGERWLLTIGDNLDQAYAVPPGL